MDEVLFAVDTPLGFRVRVSVARWDFIVVHKHPSMSGREWDVRLAREAPDEIRQSRNDASVFLFYKMERERRWVCAVAKTAGLDGFLITAYPTNAIKTGATVWPK